ncbi:MAG: class 1 fructose-bisphosphatase [Alphaproteobacteria bacterium]
MTQLMTLDAYLAAGETNDPRKSATVATIRAMADGCIDIARRIARGPLEGDLAAAVGDEGGGDVQKELDVWSNNHLIEALKKAPVGGIASEELKESLKLGEGLVAVAMDPLDGSSNIDTNVPVGTIFSIMPMSETGDVDAAFMQPGSMQLAAGYVIYGPQTTLVLTVGQGTQKFTLDPQTQTFYLTEPDVTIKPTSNEYAINASNYRHWSDGIRSYIDDCIAGEEGPRGANVNMRWIASLVAEFHRIVTRGGVFLYPGDAREGYERGRLRLIYEANPIAFLTEQAGGKAINGQQRVLDVVPTAIHQRTPLIFGSTEEIERIARYKADPNTIFERSPLFGRRGLLRT